MSGGGFTGFPNPTGAKIPYAVDPPWGVTFMAELTLAANATSFSTIFPQINSQPFANIAGWINVTGYGGTDVVSLRFNGDSGANYQDQVITAAAGTTTFTNTNTVSTTLLRCGLPVAVGRSTLFQIVNFATKNKVVQVPNWVGSASAGTASIATVGCGGAWFNILAQVNQIDVLTAGGLNILAGSTLTVIAWN